jgi:hypothetical protein
MNMKNESYKIIQDASNTQLIWGHISSDQQIVKVLFVYITNIIWFEAQGTNNFNWKYLSILVIQEFTTNGWNNYFKLFKNKFEIQM